MNARAQTGYTLIEALAVTVLLALATVGALRMWNKTRIEQDASHWAVETHQLFETVREQYGSDFAYHDIPTSASGYAALLPDIFHTGTNVHSPTGGNLTLRRGASGAITGYASGESFELFQQGYSPERCIQYVRRVASYAKVVMINNVTVKRYREDLQANYATRCTRRNNTIILRAS